MPRGFGFIENTPAEAATETKLFDSVGEPSIVGLARAGTAIATSRDWRHMIDRYVDQGRSNTCLGQFVRNGAYLAGVVQGMPIEAPSARWAYDVARFLDARGVLIDRGCSPVQMRNGVAIHGLVAERLFDWTPPPFSAPVAEWDAFINEPPPFTLDVAAASAKLTGWSVIDDGASAPEQMRAASDRGHFPGMAIEVHDSFFDIRGSEVYDEPRGELRGLHMVTVAGYRPGEILILNSYGEDWADQGCAWVSDRFIREHSVYRCVITAAPVGLAK